MYDNNKSKHYMSSRNNTKIKCLITDFDETFFRTSISADLRKTRPIDWDKVYALIPQFEMYSGWKEVMTWLKENDIKFAVVSQATRGVLSRTFKHFGIEPVYVGCYDRFHKKPHARNLEKALEALGLEKDEVISVGNSYKDFLQAQQAGVRFVGACWDSLDVDQLKQHGQTIDSPLELIKIISESQD